jgi:hypothetical protein
MPDSERFTVRAYRDGDEKAILDLFARSFPHAPRTHEHFDWKYRRNPFGNERISLAFDGDHLVGHYAGYPVRLYDHGETYLAHQIGDTMTDPAVRHVGRGPTSILGRTARHFYDTFCEGQAGFNFGFNVANIQRFSIRFLGSDRVEGVTHRVRERPFAPVTRAERLIRGYRLELVRDAGDELDELFARVAPAYGFLIQRDASYIRWRYLEAPDEPKYFIIAIRKWGRLCGWAAFRIRERRLLWGDALFDPRHLDAMKVLLRHVVPQYPVDVVEAWFPPRPQWLDGALTSLGFEIRPEPQDLGYMCVPFVRRDAVTHIRQSLYYTMGDSDLF